MAPVRSRVISVAIRAIVIATWVIGRPVEGRKWDRYWQTEMEEDPGLRLGLSQKGDSKDHCQYDNNFFHIVTDEIFDFRLHHTAKGGSVLGTMCGRYRRRKADGVKVLIGCAAMFNSWDRYRKAIDIRLA
jgi:hypothetical protein